VLVSIASKDPSKFHSCSCLMTFGGAVVAVVPDVVVADVVVVKMLDFREFQCDCPTTKIHSSEIAFGHQISF
jgi:hypothetical protein